MNRKMIAHILAKMLGVEALLLILPAIVGVIYQEKSAVYFLPPIILLTLIYLIGRKKPKNSTIYAKEGMVVVALAWILWSLFGALPFFLSGYIPSYLDAFFETVSGFTTTGSSIMPDVEILPQCMHFWRSFTHWIGGMGIVVLSLAILPMLGVGGQSLFNAEVPGVKTHDDQLTPRIASTAKILFMVYFALTLMETILLWLGGMHFFDAVCHSFSTIATGGFSTKNNSIAYYNSSYIQVVITVFMFLSGCNFILHYRALKGLPLKQYLSEEYRFFAGILITVTLIITVTLLFSHVTDPMSGEKYHMSPWLSLRAAAFQVVALSTTTGFSTADYTVWPGACGMLLLGLIFMGACGGSTAGGMKCVRLLLFWKYSFSELRRCIFPRSLQDIRLDGKRMETPVLNKALGFLAIYVLTVFLFATLLPMVCEMDMITSISASATCISNAGPGFGRISPMNTFSWMNPPAKLLLALEMLIGRLELYTILIVFLPSFWKK